MLTLATVRSVDDSGRLNKRKVKFSQDQLQELSRERETSFARKKTRVQDDDELYSAAQFNSEELNISTPEDGKCIFF